MGAEASSQEPRCQSTGNRTEGYTYRDTIGWHGDKDLNDAVTKFHDKYARPPRSFGEAREMHIQLMSEIEQKLREANICSRIEYTGSSYEGVKVSKSSTDDDLEFDVMIIMVKSVISTMFCSINHTSVAVNSIIDNYTIQV